jgi:hypothetical protein
MRGFGSRKAVHNGDFGAPSEAGVHVRQPVDWSTDAALVGLARRRLLGLRSLTAMGGRWP